jgi:hypothetical protein
VKRDGVNWIRLGRDRVHWRAVVNTVMKFWEFIN